MFVHGAQHADHGFLLAVVVCFKKAAQSMALSGRHWASPMSNNRLTTLAMLEVHKLPLALQAGHAACVCRVMAVVVAFCSRSRKAIGQQVSH